MDSKSKHFKVLDLLFTMISSIEQYSLVRPGWSPNSSLSWPKLNSIFKVLNFFEDPGRGWSPKFDTGLNIIIGIVQEVYE